MAKSEERDHVDRFLEENDLVVVGLREGAWLRIDGARGRLEGAVAARVFRRGRDPEERPPGSDIDDLLVR